MKTPNFDRLSKKQKRIAVAKEVLAWLRLGRMTARKRQYLTAKTLTPEGKINGYNCQACALGGLFACAVEAKKKVSLRDFALDSWSGEYGTQDQMHRFLGSFFTADELMNIENAFEGKVSNGYEFGLICRPEQFKDESAFDARAEKFNAGIRSPRKRMERIMRNIIRNKGTFVP